ncbi:MAG: hypothetical protein QOJ43_87 [Gaiellaceae bacterium]|nr:hypothetical protein [Gaiellaceae bacterium]
MTLERLLPSEAILPRWSSGSFLVYFGAFVMLNATGGLLGILGADHGEAALVGYSALAATLALGLALALEQAGRAVAAGVFATLTVVFFAVFVGALESLLGILDAGTINGDYDLGTLPLEILTIAAALVALRRFRAPLLLLPAVVALAIAIGDLGSLFSWQHAEEAFTLLVGAVLIAAGVVVDRAGRRPFAFWPHLVGGAAFGGAAVSLVSGDAGWILVGVLSLGYVAVAYALGRSSYAVLGALGILATTTYFIQDALSYVGVFVPFDIGGDSIRDPWQVALYYVAAGLVLVALGLVGERVTRSSDE